MFGSNLAMTGCLVAVALGAGIGIGASNFVEPNAEEHGVKTLSVPGELVRPKASPGALGSYSAQIISAHDGDSLRAQVTVWPSHIIEATIRLRGVDTPELNAKCDEEKILAVQARDFVRRRVVGRAVTLHTISKGKYYGRVVASVTLDSGEELEDLLLREGLARPYGGGKRADGCRMRAS